MDDIIAPRMQGGNWDPGTRRMAFRILWLGVPLVLGMMTGWHRIGLIAPQLQPGLAMLYWLPLSLMMWAGQMAGCWLAFRLGGSYVLRWPKLIVVAAGALLGTLLTRPVHALWQRLFAPLADGPVTVLAVIPLDAAQWRLLIEGNLLLMLIWVGAVWAYHALGFTLPWNLLPVESPGEVRAEPGFVRRLNRLVFDEVIAIKAEDHYLRVYGNGTSELLLYRFSDAMSDLEAAGWLRVHRSYAVRADAICTARLSGRSGEVELPGRLIVPVSTSHIGLVARLLKNRV
jgi:hypothetical protein